MGKRDYKVTWAEAFRDILITAMRKGQLPLLSFLAIIFVVVHRVPSSQIVQWIDKIIGAGLESCVMSWFFWFISVAGMVYYARQMRRHFSSEYDRMGKEKAELQQLLTGKKLPSSKK